MKMNHKMKNRVNTLFETKQKNIFSVFFTAGFPNLNDTETIIMELEKNGADLIEIGIPFSDPTADGTIIQHSSETALKNGMSLNLLFKQLKNIRQTVKIPLVLMGYINPVMQFGMEEFCKKCSETGIDGVILPDLPLEEYEARFEKYFTQYNLHNILLIAPNTPEERIRKIDAASRGFIYMVSSASTTGITDKTREFNNDYFNRISRMGLKTPRLIGFGISDHKSFSEACRHASGAIIGSAFVKALQNDAGLEENIAGFVRSIHPDKTHINASINPKTQCS